MCGNPAALRGHLLASVAAGFCSSQPQLVEFLGHTFYAHTRDMWVLEDLVDHDGQVPFLHFHCR